jgi:XisH protein
MARDIYHQAVRTALEKEGWLVTHDPYLLRTLGAAYEIDMGAEKLLAAEKDNRRIAIEVKSFRKASLAHEFHGVLGQYINYELLLAEQEPNRMLFLAVHETVFKNFFTRASTTFVLEKMNVKILVFNPSTSTIEQWIER